MFYEFEGKKPVVGKTSFVHPQAVVIGDVVVGEKCYIGAGVILRGDYGRVLVGDGSNIQENTVVHSNPESAAIIGKDVLIGHAAIVHGPCELSDNAVVGMGALVSVGCSIEADGMLAAGSVLPPGRTIPARKLAVGNPARIARDVDEQIQNINHMSVKFYQDLAGRCQQGLRPIVD
jgi:carbonic anhydrase/acetyltransferase-like protein (isoleucine patch superfamily)